MATDVSICTAALMLLGDKPIASLTQNTDRATLCANIYPQAVDDILRSHPWNCAIKREILAPLSAAPSHDFQFQFQLPGDWLRMLEVGYQDDPLPYQVEGRRILANTNVLPVRYVKQTDEGEWDALLVYVMTKRMELDLAYPITKSTSLRDTLRQEFYAPAVGVLSKAKTVDGQENPPEDWLDSPFINARKGRRY
jgi:hypothetical protein